MSRIHSAFDIEAEFDVVVAATDAAVAGGRDDDDDDGINMHAKTFLSEEGGGGRVAGCPDHRRKLAIANHATYRKTRTRTTGEG